MLLQQLNAWSSLQHKARRTCLLVGDVHIAAAQRCCHLVSRQRAAAVPVKFIKDVAQRVSVLARGDALPRQQRSRKLLHALDARAVVGLAVGGHEGGVGHLSVLLRPRHRARPHLRVALGADGHAGADGQAGPPGRPLRR
jgi:uncharacterized NAD(P)/FAD-binding protein YdhS